VKKRKIVLNKSPTLPHTQVDELQILQVEKEKGGKREKRKFKRGDASKYESLR
jgi:hypothetical protein